MLPETSYHDAIYLRDDNRCDSAASRIYYCLYQAILPKMKVSFPKPSTLLRTLRGSRYDAQEGDRLDKKGKWPHDFVIQGCARFVGSENAATVDKALQLRIRADYRDDAVTETELDAVLVKVPTILARLGVNV